ncbi:HD domain-containing protein [Fusobacterium mortiferum]|jgi:putative hydrolase of HD superfamily|uniref:HD domain-containing protein n=1 Tax=Fusobacterium mortiferum TaxID=850 RepID=A0ABS2G536_FUSMR|nr:HD domain-containing protein [Fusobacterium mortiferum]MBM6690367.1 HD domain-containing protein [Fusobacterium mortiferum]MBM6822011.1 HD domain-containing protein [Fusobacterium mortiferum]MBM6876002.1 HD domain-containing protein [Fusobacterium mortiferum]
MKKLYEQVNFLMEIDKVKGILRQSVILGDVNRRENDAEHSWHMAVCAITLKEYVTFEKVDMERVLKMILLHDLVEIYCDDTPAFSNYSKEEKYYKELAAAEKIFSLLPREQYREYFDLWVEFENMETDESKFANVFDRFQGFIQNLSSDGHTWKKWNVTKEMVIKRLEPVIKYAPKIFDEFILLEIEEYIKRGIIRDTAVEK